MINRIKERDSTTGGAAYWSGVVTHDTESSLTDKFNIRQVENFIKAYPVTLMAIGLAAGLTLGWWVKRK
ncbi:hypothetical protein [Fuerstiella marisgermanici]|uniref:Uncharacterized protein n=1 Tax=Fuerstiella marisgermanici TaxID=1891926 RepID=A0A1P8WJD0_9PLAN|nr:hypothetical protein [Fuerstiella marisgermanici]APZ94170.1 hypothetical protein Fuma_03794 [Fuerstiella marisgermanici]